MYKFTFLGTFKVEVDGNEASLSSRPAQSLLAYLVLNADSKHRREKLAGILWPEAEEGNARTYLRQNLWMLGKELGKDLFSADKLTIGLAEDADYECDVTEILEAVNGETESSELAETLMLYQGELLPGFYEDWLVGERERVNLAYEKGVQSLLRQLENGTQWREVLEWGERWIAYGRAPEPAYRALMKAHSALGDSASVASVYQRCVKDLDRELSVAPSLETQEIYARLTGLEWNQPTRNPYRGLFAFQEEDAPFFFGRESFTAKLHELVQRKEFILLCGPSGIGKSSVVFAGLVPRLRTDEGTLVVSLRPGTQPFQALERALSPFLSGNDGRFKNVAYSLESGNKSLGEYFAHLPQNGSSTRRLVLIVDQLEELYSLCPDAEIRDRFMDLLIDAPRVFSSSGAPKVSILLTLRADFTSHVFHYGPAGEALHDAMIGLGPMTREELARAVKLPAQKGGGSCEPGLADRILEDVGRQPGNLPLLEFALTQLWERKSNGKLTHQAYDAIRGVQGALARHAEEVFEDLSPNEQEEARRIFVQLVQPGQQTADSRRVAGRADFPEITWSLIQKLADERLLITGRDPLGEQTVELVHEALVNEWQRLTNWMESDRQFRSWQEGLRANLRQWEASEREESALMRGAALAEAERWLEQRSQSISRAEARYIRASAAQEKERLETGERTRRRTLISLAGGLVAALVLAALAGFSWAKSERDERSALEAYSLSLAANAQQLLGDHDSVSALAVAMAAGQLEDPPAETLRVLRDAAFSPGPRKRWLAEDLGGEAGNIIPSVALSPDGSTALTNITPEGTLVLFDIRTGEVIKRLEGHSAFVLEIEFTDDGQRAVSSSEDGSVILWDLETGELIHKLTGHSSWVMAVALSPDGTQVVSAGLGTQEISLEALNTPGEIILWDLETGQEIRRFEGGHTQLALDVEFGPYGYTILSSSGLRKASDVIPADSNVVLWEVETGDILMDMPDITPNPTRIAVSPDGKRALVGSMEEIVYEVNLSTGEVIAALDDQSDWISDVEFTSDGERALVSGGDGEMVLWDLSSHSVIARLKDDTLELSDLDISSGGAMAVSSSVDGWIMVWDLQHALELNRFEAHNHPVSDLVYSADGELLVSASQDNTIRIWNGDTQRLERILRGHSASVTALAISPDGEKLLSGASDGSLILWDVPTGNQIAKLEGHTGDVNAIVFHPFADKAYSGSQDLTIIEWDLQELEIEGYLLGADLDITDMAIDPDGEFLVSSTLSTLLIWDLETGEQVRHLYGQKGYVLSNQAIGLDQSGQTLITGHGTFDSAVNLWDLENGENFARIEMEDPVVDVAITPDGSRGYYALQDGTVVQLDVERGASIWNFNLSQGAPVSLVVNPTANQVAIGLDNGEVVILNSGLLSGENIFDWVQANRHVRELSCFEKVIYQVEPLCQPVQVDLEIEEESASDADFLSVPAREPLHAEVGVNRGELPLGDFQIWEYGGQAGEVLSIYMNADDPGTVDNIGQSIANQSLDPVLVLIAPSGNLLAVNRIYVPPGEPYTVDAAIVDLELPETGTYRIEARSEYYITGGGYELIIESSLQ